MRLLILALVGSGACFREISERTDSTGATAMATLPPTAMVDSAVALAVAGRAAATARSSADTGAIIASMSELEELSSAMIIPVQAVAARDLRDTYAEARGNRVHHAIDIPAPRGTPVLAATDGRLLKLFSSKPGGLMVYASDAADRFVMMYGHLDRYADGLTEGMALRRGQLIGYVGTTGNAPIGTPHLHFAVARGRPRVSWWQGTAVNPYPLLVHAP